MCIGSGRSSRCKSSGAHPRLPLHIGRVPSSRCQSFLFRELEASRSFQHLILMPSRLENPSANLVAKTPPSLIRPLLATLPDPDVPTSDVADAHRNHLMPTMHHRPGMRHTPSRRHRSPHQEIYLSCVHQKYPTSCSAGQQQIFILLRHTGAIKNSNRRARDTKAPAPHPLFHLPPSLLLLIGDLHETSQIHFSLLKRARDIGGRA